MKPKFLDRDAPFWVPAVLAFLLASVGILHYAGFVPEKYLTIAFGIGIMILLGVGDLRRLLNWPSLFLLGYVFFSMLTLVWAISGKFFLQQYSSIFIAAFFFLLVVLWKRNDRHFVRHVLSVLVCVSTLYALGGLEGAATHNIARLLYFDPSQISMTNRLNGIFHNANIESSFYAIGILFSVALICDGERKTLSRAVWSVTLAINSVAMILSISLGAIASLACGIIAYLIYAGKGRASVLLRLMEGLLPAAFSSFVTVSYFNAESKPEFPFILTLFAAMVTALFELKFVGKAVAALERHGRLIRIVLTASVVLMAVYLVAALHISTPYTFGKRLARGVSLSPGEHTLQMDADSGVTVKIYSRSREDIMKYSESETASYAGEQSDVEVDGMNFTVPKDSVICMLYFDGEEGSTIRSATLDGHKKVMMTYCLLPAFVAERLQGGLTANNSYVIRSVLWQNGLKLFLLSPIVGNGVGSFESGITRVQDFYFETRFAHQHYIQVLLESGVIGFLLFTGTLVTLLISLLKKRRADTEDPFFWIYPALFAELITNGIQMFWDVSMSILPFLCCTYAVYGLIVTTCAEPLPLFRPVRIADGDAEPDSEAAALPARQEISLPTRVLTMLLPFVFIISICGNLYASNMLDEEFTSYEDAYSAMENAVKYDLYEYNDIKLTYLLTSMEDESQGRHISQANIYAEELSKEQSNSLPFYLTGYYFNTQQYGRSIDAAKLGAVYSASDDKQWNRIIDLLKQGFVDSGVDSPLLTESNGSELVQKLAEYRQMLLDRNTSALVPIRLTEGSQYFINMVEALDACGGDKEAMAALLSTTEQDS